MTTRLKKVEFRGGKACALKRSVVNKRELLFMKSEVVREGSSVHALVFFCFSANSSMNPDVFSLKPSASQGELCLKISAHSSGLVVLGELGNKQTDRLTHSLTSHCFYRVI